MINKTEMVSVPRELLERLQLALSNCYCPEASVTTDLWKVLSAPAEDVRAVVDEPVACPSHGEKVCLQCDWPPRSKQRPVVMLMRKPVVVGLDSESSSQNKAWNACIDEFERLNWVKP